MQRKKIDWGKLGTILYPFLPPLVSVVLLALQPVYSIRGDVTVLLNILLLGMDLAEFLPLLMKDWKVKTGIHLAGLGAIAFMAVLYNLRIAELPLQFSNAAAFLTSWYGMWSIAALLEAAGLCILAMWRVNEREKQQMANSGAAAVGGQQSNTAGSGTAGSTPQQTPAPAQQGAGRRSGISFGAKSIGAAFWIGGLLLPFLPLYKFGGWLETVRKISEVFYGSAVADLPESVAVIGYFVFLFAIVVGGYVLWQLSLYTVDRARNKDSTQKSFYEEYSTPITLLVVVGVLALSGHQMESNGLGNASDWLEIAGQLFAWMFVLIVGIIAAFVIFETTRLILKQCLDRGSLLQTSMHLIFVLVVEYTVGFLMGILQMFALKNVIESILCFFMPDLEDTMGPKVSRVLHRALEQEVETVSRDSRNKHEDETHCVKGKKGWRRYRRGGGYHEK